MTRTIPVASRQIPSNFGPLRGANANARLKGPCDDTMEFWLCVEGDRIEQASFTTDGCGASILSGAMAAHLVLGKTLAEACQLTPKQIEEAIGGLPEDHQHCPVLALNTLKLAVAQLQRENAPCPVPPARSSGSGGEVQNQPADTGRQGVESAGPPQDDAVAKSVSRIRHKVLVLSGKGGVGKSTVAANLATALAASGRRVGLLDVDIHGPSIPKLLGLEQAQLAAGAGQIRPVPAGPNLKVMSIGFVLPNNRDAVVWRGPLKAGLIRQFLAEVAWGDLDVLVVDCPPGTGDEPLSVAQMIGTGASAVVVTTPQEVAIADVRRSVTFCQKLKLDVLGIVENMSGLVCPHCGKEVALFGAGGGEALAREMHVPFLGRIPLDPEVVESGDRGTPLGKGSGKGPSAGAFERVVRAVLPSLEVKQETDVH